MNTFSKAFEEMMAAIPQTLLADVIKRKLDAKGVNLSEKKIHLLAATVLNGEPTDSASFLDRIKKKLGLAVQETVIELTDGDLKEIEEALEEYVEGLPQTVQDILEQSPHLLELLKKDWPRAAKRLKREREAFKKRLYDRWGDGIHLLRMLITIARDVGSEIHESGRKAAATPLSASVLAQLHARGCQIAEEVVCLLEGGFADGAMARWRTLHEISAVSALIHNHGEELAERYIEHDAIECARAARQYQKYYARLGGDAIAADDIQEIEERAKALKEKYGKEFGGSNGWAAKHLGIADPKIDQLIAAAKIDHLLPYYKIASHNVHANPRGIFFKLGIIGETEALLAGSSNAGLSDPGQNTAISLMQITMAVALSEPTLDDLIAIKIIQQLADEIGNALAEAREQLEQDEALLKKLP